MPCRKKALKKRRGPKRRQKALKEKKKGRAGAAIGEEKKHPWAPAEESRPREREKGEKGALP